jgi:hypothetical protein
VNAALGANRRSRDLEEQEAHNHEELRVGVERAAALDQRDEDNGD